MELNKVELNVFEKDFFRNFARLTEINTYVIVCILIILVHLPGYSYNYNFLYLMGGITIAFNFIWHRLAPKYIGMVWINIIESFVHVILLSLLAFVTGDIESPFLLFLFLPLIDSIGSKKILHNVGILVIIELIYILFLITGISSTHFIQVIVLMIVSIILDVRVILTRIQMLKASDLARLHESKVEELTELNNYKDEFVNVTTHELRTPITVLKGYADLLRQDHETKFSEKGHEILQNLIDEANSLGELVEELLDITRLETGRITINKTTFNLVHLVEDILEGQKVQAENKSINLRFVNKLEDNTDINTDKDRLKEVLINLIDNAIKYSPKGGIVTVYTRIVDNRIELSVKDNGIGIPAEDQTRIFQKFFRAKNVYSLASKGTGLGLYIVYRLVDRLKGYIQFTSEENKGTTFRVMLPIK